MAGRPKVQFTPEDGERFWRLFEEVGGCGRTWRRRPPLRSGRNTPS
jgi:hypothetical protein